MTASKELQLYLFFRTSYPWIGSNASAEKVSTSQSDADVQTETVWADRNK